MYLSTDRVLLYVRVIVATGSLKTCERFVEELARFGSIAIIKRSPRPKVRCDPLDATKDVLCVQSQVGCSFRSLSSDYEGQIIGELNRLAEQEEVNFTIVCWNEPPLRLIEKPEVYKASLEEMSKEFEIHLERIKAAPEWMSLGVAVKAVKANPLINRAGAILTFTGIVRGDADALLFDIYEGEAQKRIAAIINDLRHMEGIVDVQIHHSYGRISLGEDIVYIVVAASHRQEGFAALREAIERIKSEVPIWKKELTEAGGHWVGV